MAYLAAAAPTPLSSPQSAIMASLDLRICVLALWAFLVPRSAQANCKCLCVPVLVCAYRMRGYMMVAEHKILQ